jgi:cell division protein FtsB
VLLVLLAGYLYAGPVRSYLDARERTAQDRQQLARLTREQTALRVRFAALSSPGAIQALARADGYVMPGETPLSAQFADNR